MGKFAVFLNCVEKVYLQLSDSGDLAKIKITASFFL